MPKFAVRLVVTRYQRFYKEVEAESIHDARSVVTLDLSDLGDQALEQVGWEKDEDESEYKVEYIEELPAKPRSRRRKHAPV